MIEPDTIARPPAVFTDATRTEARSNGTSPIGSNNGTDPTASPPPAGPDPYRGPVAVLLALSVVAVAGAVAGGRLLGDKALFELAVTFGLAAGILVGVLAAQWLRTRPGHGNAPAPDATPEAPNSPLPVEIAAPSTESQSSDEAPVDATTPPVPEEAAARLFPDLSKTRKTVNLLPSLTRLEARFGAWFRGLGFLGVIRLAVGIGGLVATAVLFLRQAYPVPPTPLVAAIGAAACVVAAILCATAARYLSEVDADRMPEAPGLARGARVTAWILAVAAGSIGLEWAVQFTLLRVFESLIVAVNVALCWSLLAEGDTTDEPPVFPLDLAPLSVLGSRTNILASVLDVAERQLGIDLRSTWALTVVRRSLEPLAIAFILLAWVSTSLTVVSVEEQGLVERLGVPVSGAPLAPGLHVHWPWPVDHVSRLPIRRVQSIGVGHEGEEKPGPENVIWSVQHAANEFTLLLGNGRDLITVDAAVQYRIVDARAWRYRSQNPEAALKALAYRAVMRNTVNRTLSEALSENLAALTERMRSMVQEDADALGLGVQVVGFTVGGMHPPVPVAPAYEAVVSAQINKVTVVVSAQVLRNQTLPAAEDTVLVRANAARADGAEALARAAGEAWSFRTLEAQYRAAPSEYFFRRRLETLEKDLAGRAFTVLDSRFVRDGGEVWVIP